MNGKRLQIKVLGGWRATYDGEPLGGGSNLKLVLHALVFGRSGVYREDLAALLAEQNRSAKQQDQAVRNALSQLRKLSLDIPSGENPVFMNAFQPHASIDLWDFFAHVRCRRYQDAAAMIENGEEPHLFRGDDDRANPIWKDTFEEFRKARDATFAALNAMSGRRRSMLTTRERLLARSLVPGVGHPLAIRDVRAGLEPLRVPWEGERPQLAGEARLTAHLAEILTRKATIPTQAILVGGSGSGKTLTAISAFLRLTDRLAGDPTHNEARTVLYVDAEAEGSQPGFGSDEWLEQRLREAGAEGGGSPIVIMPHGDVFLASRQQELRAVLDSRLFRHHDLLFCCSSQFYSRRLCYEEFGTDVIHLLPWPPRVQKAFAGAVAGERKCEEFERWLEADSSRKWLCGVPLHLVHVLSLLGEGSEALTEISTPPQLFEGVARMRLRVSGCPFDEDQVINDLAGLAHRFYVDATPSDRPIRFSTEELKVFLRSRGRKALKRRAIAMADSTLLIASSPGADTLRFEDPSWGWYLLARHIVHTTLYEPDGTLRAFSKLLSARMADLCEEMLAEKLTHYRNEIYASLEGALRAADEGLEPGRLTIARQQVGYLLGALGDAKIRQELAPMVEPGSGEREPDPLVRRGIALGLADGGAVRFADVYVEALTTERDSGGPAPERDANIGFLLSSRGDQELDPERPGQIGKGVAPIRTIGDLVRELDDSRHPGSARIKLFTLLDLARHPAIGEEGFERAFAPHRERAEALARRLEADTRRRRWPETATLKGLLVRPGERLESVPG